VSISPVVVLLSLVNPQKKNKELVGFVKQKEGRRKKSGNNLRLFCERFGLLFVFFAMG
jgi:hypothetical protein